MLIRTLSALVLGFHVGAAAAAEGTSAPGFSSESWWLPQERARQAELESRLDGISTAASLRAFHDLLGSEPHVAGSEGDARNIDRIVAAFTQMGLEPERDEFWAYLCRPVEAKLEITDVAALMNVSGSKIIKATTLTRGVLELSLREEDLPEDQAAQHRALNDGWNAYSGNGDVTAEVVYANYGTKEDFEKLKELNVDVAGKIVLARYGGNFRGYKAKYAQLAGAAGLVIYTDPDDSGYRKGLTYPEGGWANASCIQRGSINTLDYPGDPLTPGEPASKDAQRLDPAALDLPKIPVQPVGYGAAQEIMMRMRGTPLPEPLIKTWQGGLPCAYRLTGGPGLKVRLMVKQERAITHSANVITQIPGEKFPDQKVIIGCHHDAWGYGAGDPLAGSILVMEAAKCFAELRKQGVRPARTIVFALWGAEEFGIVGSTEYCEGRADELMRTAVAYINLDAATMGVNFGASASPSLRRIIREAAMDVPQARDASGKSAYDVWKADKPEAECESMGGGSDHIGFYCRLGIPSCGLGASGSPGTAYHSNYDDLIWYRKVVGEDYLPALMMTRIVNRLAARLADASLLPLDPLACSSDARKHVEAIQKRAGELKFEIDLKPLLTAIDAFEQDAARPWASVRAKVDSGAIEPAQLDRINQGLLLLERQWLVRKTAPSSAPENGSENDGFAGLSGHPWFRNWYGSSDPTSGYASWVFPAIREALENRDAAKAAEAVERCAGVFRSLATAVRELDGSGQDQN